MRILLAPAEGLYRDKGSKFLAFASPVAHVEDVESHVASIRKKYHDARHWCTAYRLGHEGEIMFSNDDGEPSNTAGAPILGAIRSNELTLVSVVVVRYFGGIKLGVRGLIDAYRGAAEDAIQQAELAEVTLKQRFRIRFGYPETSHVNQVLHNFPTTQIDSNYTDTCELTLSIASEHYPAVESALTQARIDWEKLEETFGK